MVATRNNQILGQNNETKISKSCMKCETRSVGLSILNGSVRMLTVGFPTLSSTTQHRGGVRMVEANCTTQLPGEGNGAEKRHRPPAAIFCGRPSVSSGSRCRHHRVHRVPRQHNLSQIPNCGDAQFLGCFRYCLLLP